MAHNLSVSELTELLRRFENVLDGARRLPWTRRILVDEGELRTLLNQIQHVLPEEVRQSRWIIQERDKILQEAGREAEDIREQARQESLKLLQSSGVVVKAEAHAKQIVEQARRHVEEMHQGAKEYADGVLQNLQQQLEEILATIEDNRGQLRQ